jgi:translation initiation factor IF-2
LVAEIGELKADPHGKAEGVIIESRLDKGRGPVATVLVRTGTLKVGDIFVSGPTSGRIRALFDDKGKKVNSAPPSMPVEVLGFQDVPNPGNMLKVVESEQEAREIAEKNLTKQKKANRIAHSLADFSLEVEKGEKKNLNLVLKADVRGSLDALVKSLGDIDVSGLHVNILHRGIGNITESDVLLAEASNAIVAGFNVEMESRAREIAESEGVEVRNYSIIYKMLDDMKLALTGILKPEYEEVIIGVAEVRQTFKYSKLGVIAGSFINSGKFVRGSGLRIFRGKEKVFEGKVESLKRFKDDVKEVLEGYECGVAIQNFTDFKAGDILQCFEMREKAKK